MKFSLLLLLACAVFVAAEVEMSVLSNLETIEEKINAHGLAAVQAKAAEEFKSMSVEQQTQLVQLASEMMAQGDDKATTQAPKKDDGINVSFKWSNVDVRNFLSWVISQDPSKGTLSDIHLGQGGGEHDKKKKEKKHLTEEEKKHLEKLQALRELDTAGEHGGYHWYRVRVQGTMNSDSIYAACHKHDLLPACALNGWNDGRCQSTQYSDNRYMSYMPHNLEDWQNWFNLGLYFYSGNANGGWPLQNVWGTHQWTYWGHENRWTLCTTNKKPEWHKWQELHASFHESEGKIHEHAERRHHQLKKLKEFSAAGNHHDAHWFSVPVEGQMVSSNIQAACLKYNLMPACCYHGWSLGNCVDSPYSWGRYFSYPGHNIEGWENSFNNGIYFMSEQAYYGYSLRNWGGSHYWSGGDSNGNAMCVSFRNPFEHWEFYEKLGKGEGHHEKHHHHDEE